MLHTHLAVGARELSYDMFHPEADRIYRLVQEQRFSGSVQQVAVVAAPVAPALTNDFPEVEIAVRVRPLVLPPEDGSKNLPIALISASRRFCWLWRSPW